MYKLRQIYLYNYRNKLTFNCVEDWKL